MYSYIRRAYKYHGRIREFFEGKLEGSWRQFIAQTSSRGQVQMSLTLLKQLPTWLVLLVPRLSTTLEQIFYSFRDAPPKSHKNIHRFSRVQVEVLPQETLTRILLTLQLAFIRSCLINQRQYVVRDTHGSEIFQEKKRLFDRL